MKAFSIFLFLIFSLCSKSESINAESMAEMLKSIKIDKNEVSDVIDNLVSAGYFKKADAELAKAELMKMTEEEMKGLAKKASKSDFNLNQFPTTVASPPSSPIQPKELKKLNSDIKNQMGSFQKMVIDEDKSKNRAPASTFNIDNL